MAQYLQDYLGVRAHAQLQPSANVQTVARSFSSFLAAPTDKVPTSLRQETIAAILDDLSVRPSQPPSEPSGSRSRSPKAVWQDWSDPVRAQSLEVLRLLGREQEGSNALSEDKAFETLAFHAGLLRHPTSNADALRPSPAVADQALRCIANSLLLHADGRSASFWTRGANGKPSEPLQNLLDIVGGDHYLVRTTSPFPLTFLAARTVFLLTAQKGEVAEAFLAGGKGFKALETRTKAYQASLLGSRGGQETQSVTDMTEILKAGFNLIRWYLEPESATKAGKRSENQAESLLPSLVDLANSLPADTSTSNPLSHVFNIIVAFPVSVPNYASSFRRLPPKASSTPLERAKVALSSSVARNDSELRSTLPWRVLNLLDQYLQDMEASPEESSIRSEADNTLSPLVSILASVVQVDDGMRAFLRQAILPKDRDRTVPPEKASNLTGRLVRLMCADQFVNANHLAGKLLLALCEGDVPALNLEVGFGNAAGFLASMNIMQPPPSTSENDTSDHDPMKVINPITGVYMDPPSSSSDSDPLADMTAEEKEREAERLVVLFERLRNTGVMKMGEDPRRAAMERDTERFRELDEAEQKASREEEDREEEEALRELERYKARKANR